MENNPSYNDKKTDQSAKPDAVEKKPEVANIPQNSKVIPADAEQAEQNGSI